MSENKGWISIYRKFVEWEWYDYPSVKIIFLHCLLCANHKNAKWRDITVKRGQLVTSYDKLAAANGLSVQQVRTALEKLQSTNEITYQSTSQYSIITVKNYNLYQDNNKQKTEAHNNQLGGRNNKQITTNNNDNKRDINKLISLSIEERDILKKYLLELNEKRKNKIEDIDAYIRKLVENGDCLTKLEKAKKKLERQKAKEVIPPPEKIEEEACKMTADEVREFVQSKVKWIPKRRKGEKNDTNNSN